MKKLVSHSALFVALLLVPVTAFGSNSKHYYRAGSYAHETRYELDWLSTAGLEVSGGRATKSYDANRNKVDLLGLYGQTPIVALGAGEIGNPASSVYNFDLGELIRGGSAAVVGGVGYNYAGKFTMFEANLYFAQNLCKGFFVDVNLPVKKLEVKDIVATDSTDAAALAAVPAAIIPWENTKANITTILTQYSLDTGAVSKSGVGDMMVNLGWTYNNDDLENMDFLDTTLKVGVSIPTASKRNEDKVFEIALGHDNHVGIGTSFDMAFGLYEWVTIGAHVGGLFFFKKTAELRMNTTAGQNGYLKLLKGNAKRDMGHIWDVGSFVKADHIFKGFSLLFGYNYVRKDNDTLTPENLTRFPSAAVNADTMLQGWKQHNITVALEYDMAEEGRRFNPHFGLFYSRPVSGKYIFKTDVGGGSVGVNMAWDF